MTVRVPAPAVRSGPNTKGSDEQGHDDHGEDARDPRPVADLIDGGIEAVAAQVIDIRPEAASVSKSGSVAARLKKSGLMVERTVTSLATPLST